MSLVGECLAFGCCCKFQEMKIIYIRKIFQNFMPAKNYAYEKHKNKNNKIIHIYIDFFFCYFKQ